LDFSFVYNFTTLSALLLIFGLILIIVEMFYPGFGVPGTVGAILLTLAVYMTVADLWQALAMIAGILFILGAVLLALLRSAARGRLSKTLILSESLVKESGYSGTEANDSYLGKTGRTLTMLRPAGTAEFDGAKLDVVSEGEYIEKNSSVKVIKVEGRRIVVREIN